MEQDNSGDSEQEHRPTHAEDVPIVADQPHSSPATQVSSDRRNGDDNKNINWADRWMVRLTAAIAFFGLCAVLVAYFQWDAMHGQLAEMKSSGDQTERLVILGMGQLAVAARDAQVAQDIARSVQQQAIVSRKTFEASNRPYLGIDSVENVADKMKPTMDTTIYIKNFGSNPADNVHITRHWYVNGIESPRKNKNVEAQGTIYPGVVRSLEDRIYDVDFDGLNTGRLAFWVRVEITYMWAKKNYAYCEEFEYGPLYENFLERGSCQLTVKHD